jgi:S1-C subfamily serine protease
VASWVLRILPFRWPALAAAGTESTITIQRKAVVVPFGFGVASMWRLEGRVNVVSWVDPEGEAMRAGLEAEDILLDINGEVLLSIAP